MAVVEVDVVPTKIGRRRCTRLAGINPAGWNRTNCAVFVAEIALLRTASLSTFIGSIGDCKRTVALVDVVNCDSLQPACRYGHRWASPAFGACGFRNTPATILN